MEIVLHEVEVVAATPVERAHSEVLGGPVYWRHLEVRTAAGEGLRLTLHAAAPEPLELGDCDVLGPPVAIGR